MSSMVDFVPQVETSDEFKQLKQALIAKYPEAFDSAGGEEFLSKHQTCLIHLPTNLAVGFAWLTNVDETWDISIVIDPNYQGLGLGLCLLKFTENYALKNNIKELVATVNPRNPKKDGLISLLKKADYHIANAPINPYLCQKIWSNNQPVNFHKILET